MALHSLVIPVFNEAQGLEKLFERLCCVLKGAEARLSGASFEVILVNDGSRDGSAEILDALHRKDSRFKALHLSRNFGHQVAITAGIAHASGDTVTVMDADLQDPPEVVMSFIEKWSDGFEVVYGVRKRRDGETWFKRSTASLFYRLIRKMTGLDIPVDTGDFRLMDRKVVDSFLELPERHRYIRGLVSWVGFRQIGVPYDRAMREFGMTHYPFHKMLKLAIDGIASFSFFPLRMATGLGFIVSAGAFLGLLFSLYLRFFTDRTIHGWTSLMVVVLFLGGVQLLSLGVIGEYLGRMFDEVRQRPLYFVSRRAGLSSESDRLRRRSHGSHAA